MKSKFCVRHGQPTLMLNHVEPAGPIQIYPRLPLFSAVAPTRPHKSAAGVQYEGLPSVGYYPPKVKVLKHTKATPEHLRFALQLIRSDGSQYVQKHGTIYRAAPALKDVTGKAA